MYFLESLCVKNRGRFEIKDKLTNEMAKKWGFCMKMHEKKGKSTKK